MSEALEGSGVQSRTENYLTDYRQSDMDEYVVPIHNMPDDCLVEIFSLLPFIDRIRIQRVCRRWRDISRISWHRHKTLSLDEEDWGLPTAPLDLSVLRNTLNLCGRFVTRVEFSSQVGYPGYPFVVSRSLFVVISELCPNVTAIHVEGVFENTKCIEHLAELHTNLTELRIAGCSEPNLDRSVALLFERNANLRVVGLSRLPVDSKCWLSLNPEAIGEIDVWGIQKPVDNFCAALRSFKNIEKFYIHYWILHWNQTDGEYYPNNYNDYSSDLTHILKAIESHAERLKVLKINHCYEVDSKSVSCFQNLEKLVLLNLAVSNQFIEVVCKNCINLIHVELSGLINVTDIGVKSIARLPKLQILHLSNMQKISDKIFNFLFSLKELHCVDCPALETVAVCEYLRVSKNLKCLEINSWESACIRALINVAKEITENQVYGRVARYIQITDSLLDNRDGRCVQNKYYILIVRISITGIVARPIQDM